MAATVQVTYYSGAGPATESAEAGIVFNREDTRTGTTPVPIPTALGTNYSWRKTVALEVTGTDSTSLSNRRVRMASAPTTGLYLFFQDGGDTYTQSASGNKPTDDATGNGEVPAGYTAMTQSNQLWDNASESAGSTGRNGNYLLLLGGIGFDFAGGGGNNSLPNITVVYDES